MDECMSGWKDGLIVAVLVSLLCVLFASLFLYNKDTMVCVCGRQHLYELMFFMVVAWKKICSTIFLGLASH